MEVLWRPRSRYIQSSPQRDASSCTPTPSPGLSLSLQTPTVNDPLLLPMPVSRRLIPDLTNLGVHAVQVCLLRLVPVYDVEPAGHRS